LLSTSVFNCSSPSKNVRRTWFGRTIAQGLAAGGESLLGYKPRRPRAGLLKHFRLSLLRFKSRTAMEPELGLLMSSLAGVGHGKSVLDPFCGSASLLVAAR